MASLTIRNVDADLKARLRVRAATHGQSMEEEARQILRGALTQNAPQTLTLADAFARTFGALGGVDLPEREQEPLRAPPTFD